MKIEIMSNYLDTRIEVHDNSLSHEAENDISNLVINLRKEIVNVIEIYREEEREPLVGAVRSDLVLNPKSNQTLGLNIPDIHDALEAQRLEQTLAVKEFPELKYKNIPEIDAKDEQVMYDTTYKSIQAEHVSIDDNQDAIERGLDVTEEDMNDTAGIPWDKRIHASTRVKNDDGTWRRKRGVSPSLIKKVEAEITRFLVPNPPANITLIAPAPPITAPPVSAPPVIAPAIEIIDTPAKLQQYISRVTLEERVTYSDVVDALKEFGLNSTADLFTPGNEGFTTLVYAKIKSYIVP